jgi:hypothetical protein
MRLKTQTLQTLAQECASRKPYNESVWLAVNEKGDLKTYITGADVQEIRGTGGYCTVAIARNMNNPKASDIICGWAYYITGEQLSVEQALNVVGHEAEHIASFMAW